MPINPTSIPQVQGGQVITSDQFNQMRQAIIDLSSNNSGGSSQQVVITVPPIFLPVQDLLQWHYVITRDGVAAAAPMQEGPSSTSGYLLLQLPDGATVKQLAVIGEIPQTPINMIFNFILGRREIARLNGAANIQRMCTPLNLVQFAQGSDPFTATTPVNANAVVDNSHFLYLIYCEVVNSSGAKIYAIQLSCTLP